MNVRFIGKQGRQTSPWESNAEWSLESKAHNLLREIHDHGSPRLLVDSMSIWLLNTYIKTYEQQVRGEGLCTLQPWPWQLVHRRDSSTKRWLLQRSGNWDTCNMMDGIRIVKLYVSTSWQDLESLVSNSKRETQT